MRLERLAYVDDDPDIREIARFALVEIGGLDVRCWGGGAAFLAAAHDAWRPQMVLLDLGMPGISGAEVVAAMRCDAALRTVPVLVLTAVPDPGRAVEGLEGVAGWIAKPFDPLHLAAAVRAVWAGWKGQ